MKLIGWHNALPDFVEQAVHDGRLVVVLCYHKKYGEYEALQGVLVLSSGFIIEYQ